MSWQSIYHSYDEDALCVFANPGLLRRARKDVESDKVSLDQESPEQGQFTSDGQQVCLPTTGIQQATCSCPATSACKHILAAILWLHSNNSSAPTEDNTADTTSIDPLADLLSLNSAQLCKNVGISNVRTAYQFFQAWQEQQVLVTVAGSQLKITLPEFDEPIIYLAQGGFSGIISDLPSKQKHALHLAAVAYLFAQNQQEWQWPETAIPEDKQNQPLTSDELALVNHIELHLNELLAQGLSHVSQSSARQLHMLNMSARAEGLPRLAALLRNLSQHVQQLANRHFATDERETLFLMARIAAHLQSLKQADVDTLSLLRKRSRRSYQTQDQALNLTPLGASWWSSKTGAHGATFHFWDNDNLEWLECTNARTNNMDSSFTRLNVWESLALWQQTPDRLIMQPFTLEKPRLSEDNKLAFNADSRAIAKEPLNSTSYEQLKNQLGFTNFSQLKQYVNQQNSSEEGMPFTLLLHITSYEEAYLDEVEQCIVWPVKDPQGNTAFLRLFWDEHSQLRIEKLEQVLKKQPKVRAVLISPNQQDQHLEFSPFSLLIEDEKTGHIKPLCLDFELPKRFISRLKGNFVNRIIEYVKHKKRLVQSSYSQPSISQRITRPLLDCLEAQACTGRKVFTQEQKDTLTQCKEDAEQLGLTTLVNSLEQLYNQQRPILPQLLRTVYLCYVMQQMQCSVPIALAE
ncbi:hypothetical protein VQ643_00005 [Pseudomonas sp. F1_0610]|uniref:hypothetical protein n=1 Tax=Pseudomonas sp. F1_0610 TaxID=3114284 RepID=UPI0039C4A91A